MNLQQTIKSVGKRLLKRVGLEVRRASDPYQLAVYRDIYDPAALERRPFYNVGAGSF